MLSNSKSNPSPSSLANNLSSLLNECGFEPEVLADAVNISHDRMLQLLNPDSYESSSIDLKPFADFFCISVEELQGIKATCPNRIPGTYQPTYLKKYSVPIVDSEFDINSYLQLDEVAKKAFPQVITTVKVSENAFALVVGDNTISPRFPQGTILIFDPTVIPKNGDLVFALQTETLKTVLGKWNSEKGVKIFEKQKSNSQEVIQIIAPLLQAQMSSSAS